MTISPRSNTFLGKYKLPVQEKQHQKTSDKGYGEKIDSNTNAHTLQHKTPHTVTTEKHEQNHQVKGYSAETAGKLAVYSRDFPSNSLKVSTTLCSEQTSLAH